jgi:hypothetical protein
MKRSAEAAWERAMKVQEVILRAIAKQILDLARSKTNYSLVGQDPPFGFARHLQVSNPDLKNQRPVSEW